MKLFQFVLVAISLFLAVPTAGAAEPKSGIAGQLFLNLCAPIPGNEINVCLALPEPIQGTILVTQEKTKKVRVGKKRLRQLVVTVRSAVETDEKGYFFIPLKPGTYHLVLENKSGENLRLINGRDIKVRKKRFTTIDLVAQPSE